MSEQTADSHPPAPEGPKAETRKAETTGIEAPGLEAPETEALPRRRAPLRTRLRIALRSFVLAAACTLTLFWVYTFYAIGERVNPAGDGMEWMAAFPMTLVFLLLTLPTLIIGLFGRALIFGALVAVASAFVNLWVWREILAEFAG